MINVNFIIFDFDYWLVFNVDIMVVRYCFFDYFKCFIYKLGIM